MVLVQSPYEPVEFTEYDIFLAGGISNCPNWQAEMIIMLETFLTNRSVTIFNPRRVGDFAKNGEDAKAQILWEHRHLSHATDLLFWFPEETVCPITLFELGKYAENYRMLKLREWEHIHVGIHPNYSRRFDLEIQLPLIIPNIQIHYRLEDLALAAVKRINK